MFLPAVQPVALFVVPVLLPAVQQPELFADDVLLGDDVILLCSYFLYSQSSCLLVDVLHSEAVSYYTSDAADERSSVDLGGRRSIKKKKPT